MKVLYKTVALEPMMITVVEIFQMAIDKWKKYMHKTLGIVFTILKVNSISFQKKTVS